MEKCGEGKSRRESCSGDVRIEEESIAGVKSVRCASHFSNTTLTPRRLPATVMRLIRRSGLVVGGFHLSDPGASGKGASHFLA
jgi:hypothetical protein